MPMSTERPIIPYGHQCIEEDDIAAVVTSFAGVMQDAVGDLPVGDLSAVEGLPLFQ